jgi:hypothetical protein
MEATQQDLILFSERRMMIAEASDRASTGTAMAGVREHEAHACAIQ